MAARPKSPEMNQILDRVRAVSSPEPLLTRDQEASLTAREREILDELGKIFDRGFAYLTMAELAKSMNCSMTTLYNLAPSRNELVLLVVDRNVRSIGRVAHAALNDDMTALEAVRAYLRAANSAIENMTEEFASDIAAMASGSELNDLHSRYLIDVTRCLLDLAVEQGEIEAVDTAAVAQMTGSLGGTFVRPDVMAQLTTSPQMAANSMVEIVLAGLERLTTNDGD